MQRFNHGEELRACLNTQRAAGKRIGFVPTMGNLHAGHLSLVRRAREFADLVVVSIFVNPTQFAPGEDYDTYPRTPDEDCQQLQAEGVDVVFAPDVRVIYPEGAIASSHIEVPGVGQGLEEDFRPGFFAGVATVVARLFYLVQPDVAVFGEKDYQQLQVIRTMVRDLCWPIEIVAAPTVREADGLAMSSRNQYLDAGERSTAPALQRILQQVAAGVRAGSTDYAALEAEAMQALGDAGFVPDYVCIRHTDTLEPVTAADTPCIVLAAARLGQARLIDNVLVNA